MKTKQYGCTECSQILERSELVTVTNPAWVLKPTDDECCPHCKALCVELEEEN